MTMEQVEASAVPRRPHAHHGYLLHAWTDRKSELLAREQRSMKKLMDVSTNDASWRWQKDGCRQMTASTPGTSSRKETSMRNNQVRS